MAEKYRNIVIMDPTKKADGLGAAMLCYIIAAENAISIAKLFNDEANPVRQAMM